ncbi:unnamed protein product [Fraxinus pennsylvanica]|uniref:Uncharacterized protein n=1 Tax=Fraxinus pennsylvanica TaxID=56036 RepID=A0AAD2DMN7_9LAMI|nr:unnamed protein product [Fraxinus pennsylvanica]
MKIEDENDVLDLQPRTSLGAASSKPTLSGEEIIKMVGLDNELEEIRTRLIKGSSQLQILSILGMGGIAATTTASSLRVDATGCWERERLEQEGSNPRQQRGEGREKVEKGREVSRQRGENRQQRRHGEGEERESKKKG